ncbi:hypothetical protein ACFO0N_16260 [Halobium salinum]|uniref:Uncharacterized protein n=1 Tax=Halobium salinum TaxID=1364940 RepID=A0ABD5PFA0_9EURY|nr:hypothetical protein [Halobium salinum]
MAERAPELALVLGAFLGLAVLGSGLALTDDPVTTTFLALAVSLPLFVYAVYHSEDPTGVLPPGIVLKGGLGLAGLTLLALALDVGSAEAIPLRFFVALFLALVVAFAATAYHVAYGRRRYGFPPGKVAVLTTLVAAALLAFALVVASAFYDGAAGTTVVLVAALDALLVFLAGGIYATTRGLRPRPRAARLLVGLGALLGVAVAGFGLLFASPGPWVVAGVAVVLGPAVLVALSRR